MSQTQTITTTPDASWFALLAKLFVNGRGGVIRFDKVQVAEALTQFENRGNGPQVLTWYFLEDGGLAVVLGHQPPVEPDAAPAPEAPAADTESSTPGGLLGDLGLPASAGGGA